MNVPSLILFVFAGSPSLNPTETEVQKPPIAKKVAHELNTHGHVRVDEYFWLNQREDPEVISYLEAENAFTEGAMAHTTDLQKQLFEEIKGRIKQTDESVPTPLWDYSYYSRMEDGRSYPIYCRKAEGADATEEVLLDVNQIAEGHEFCSAYTHEISPSQNLLAYAADFQGRRFYNLYFRDLTSGEMLDDVLENVTGNMAWASDSKTVFYSRQDPKTLRSYQIFRHELGSDPANDELIYQEDDEEFRVFVTSTTSREYLLIGSSQTLQNEYHYLRADDPQGEWKVFLPREGSHEYDLDHFHGRFFIRSNENAQNFKLMATAEDQIGKEHWEEVVPHRKDVYFMGASMFRDFLVVSEREAGLVHLQIKPWDGSPGHELEFGEPAYRASVAANPMWDTDVVRYSYTSMTTPASVFDYDMKERSQTLLKEQEVLGGFDKNDYVTERLFAPARDGEKIPVSLVYRKGMERNGSNPLLLYGYGSYGATIDASFRSDRLSLLDRGFAFAIAHIRGSQIYGRRWYEDGKLLKKRNTFTDFIDAAEHLVDQKFTSPEHLYAMGGSAGGLLMGAVLNMRPDLFHGAIAAVPFVDVVTTMLDDSIPLTTFEYDEWGNPNNKEYYEYMLSYSPYDNVEAKDYPHLLVTTGLHDSQVQYWEPAKWVAKLRDMKTDQRRLLLKTNMDAGHGGASGRYKAYEERAFDYAFLLDLAAGTP